jgi:hypothetical protein
MLQSFAVASMPIGLDSMHFMAEIVGSPRAPVMIALSRARERGKADHTPRGQALAQLLRCQRASVLKAGD